MKENDTKHPPERFHGHRGCTFLSVVKQEQGFGAALARPLPVTHLELWGHMDHLEHVHIMEFFQVHFCARIGGCAGDRDYRAGGAQPLTRTVSVPELYRDTHARCLRVQDGPSFPDSGGRGAAR